MAIKSRCPSSTKSIDERRFSPGRRYGGSYDLGTRIDPICPQKHPTVALESKSTLDPVSVIAVGLGIGAALGATW
jgi:hypothetical protein